MSVLQNEIREFLMKKVQARLSKMGESPLALDDDFNLVNSGVVDSMGFLTLITEVESAFGIEIDFSDYEPSEFTTLGGFARYAAPNGA